MRVRPLWIVLTILVLAPVLVIAGWRALPKAGMAGRCGVMSPIEPTESGAISFSTTFRSAILDNPSGPFQLRATDIELTSWVALNTQGRQLADPQIHFLDDAVCLSGRLVGLGLLQPRFSVEAQPYIADGDVQLEIRSFTVNERVLPAPLRRLAQQVTNESIRDAALPVRVNSVHVRDGEITIAGERLPVPE